MSDKHDPNAGVPIGTFTARTDDGEFEIPIEVVVDDDIEPRQLAQLAIETPHDQDSLRFSDEPTRDQNDALPRRKRVATLLGVPLPGTLPESRDPTKATRGEINAAIDRILDEQPTTIYGAKRESDGGLAALESLVESEMVELPASIPPGEIVGVVARARETDTGTFQLDVRESDEHKAVPVLAPAQFVEARERDQVAQPSAAGRAMHGEPKPSEAARRDTRKDTALAPERAAAAPSSLAPREIARQAPQRRGEPASAAGIGLVAAMVLLGIGGWWWTAGGYKRMDQSAQPPAAASTAPASDALASEKLPQPTTPTPVAPPQVEAPQPAPTPPPVAPSKPRVASKSVRKVAPPPPAPATDGMAETPSRADVLNGLDGVRSSVQACAGTRQGVAEVDLTIAANGVVTNALVGGDFGGTPQGSCIARAVRKARFPEFKQDRYRVLFPYVL
ncbi:MAG TPA: hypothetical protein VJR89_42845 [Polyangiales bacterium]|nr:hypothetical protein [Polyangiales bacterium]